MFSYVATREQCLLFNNYFIQLRHSDAVTVEFNEKPFPIIFSVISSTLGRFNSF